MSRQYAYEIKKNIVTRLKDPVKGINAQLLKLDAKYLTSYYNDALILDTNIHSGQQLYQSPECIVYCTGSSGGSNELGACHEPEPADLMTEAYKVKIEIYYKGNNPEVTENILDFYEEAVKKSLQNALLGFTDIECQSFEKGTLFDINELKICDGALFVFQVSIN